MLDRLCKRIMNYFEEQAEQYANLYSGLTYQKFYLNYRQKKALELVTGKGTILDIGCGPGFLLKELEKFKMPLTGCDNSRKMLKIAGKNTSAKLFFADANNLPFNRKFDFVFCLGVLPYLKEPLLGLREIYRVCNRKACITYPYKKTPLSFFRENPIGIWLRKKTNIAHYQTKYERRKFLGYAEKIGFKILSEKRLFLSEFLLMLSK